MGALAGPGVVIVTTIDYHTAGEPFRIVKDGIGHLPERRSSKAALRAGASGRRPPPARLRATRGTPTCTDAFSPTRGRGRRPRRPLLPQRRLLDRLRARDDRARDRGDRDGDDRRDRAGDDAHPRRAVRAPSGRRHGEGRQGTRSFYQRAVVRVRGGLGGRDVRGGSRRHLVRRRVLRVCLAEVRGAQGRAGQRHEFIALGREIKATIETARDVVHPLEPELRDIYTASSSCRVAATSRSSPMARSTARRAGAGHRHDWRCSTARGPAAGRDVRARA